MTKQSTIWGVILILVLVIGGVWVSKKSPAPVTPGNQENIKIGSILILSGEGASWGEAARNGIDLAVKEINEKGGVDGRMLEVVHEDDGSDPQKALSALNKLVSFDKVQFVIGSSWSNTGIALIEPIKQKGVVAISPSLGLKDFNESSDFIFNTWPHDYLLSQNLAQYVYDKGHRNVALFGANDVWVKDQTKAFTEKFTSLGGKITFLSEPLVTETDMRTEVAKVKNDKNIDAIVMTIDGYGLTDIVAKRIKEFGIKLPAYSITIDRQIIKNCEGACEGLTFLTFLTPTAEFEQKYKATYNREVEIGADSAYDAVMMLAQAFRETKSTDPVVVKDYLGKITNYSGASGELVSDGKRAFTKPYLVKQVKNGEPVTITN